MGRAMRLITMQIQNFMGIGSGEIKFNNPGLVLVEGKNSDSPSSISNGAGKSTIYDALHWAFWGKTKRGIGGDDVVSNKAKKDCQVSVEFMVNGTAFTVLRTRKSAEHGNALRLWSLDGDCPDDAVDLTKGTTKETQAFLEETVKMSELTFGKVAHFGQGDVKNFAELSDAELKMVFEQALGLEFLSDTLQKVKLHKAKQEAVLNASETTRARLERECDHLREKKIYLDTAEREMKTRRAEEATRYDREAATIEAEIAALTAKKSELASVSTEAQAKFKVLSAQLATLNKTRADLTRRMNDARSALAVEKATADAKLKEAMKALEAIKAADAKVGVPCGECGKPYTPGDIGIVKDGFANRARVASAERKEHLASIGSREAGLSELTGLHEKLEGKIAEQEGVLRELAKVEATARSAAELSTTIASLAAKVSKFKEFADKIRAEAGPSYATEYAEAATALHEAERELAVVLAETAFLKEEIEMAGVLEGAFGNGGMKSYLLDNITPELNKLIDRYIKVLDDIDIEVSTVATLKSGESREKFNIGVVNKYGASTYAGNSGGEKQKVNLAISLAFNTLVRTLAGNPLNCLFLDEPFESLDEGSTERVIELCGMLDLPNIFVITHQQAIKDMIPSRILVEKTKGIGKII